MATTITIASTDPQPPSWPLKSFGMADYFMSSDADMQLHLRLDHINNEFGLAIMYPKKGAVMATVAQFIDDDPVYFHASWAVDACHVPSANEPSVTAKVVIRLPDCQIDILFESHGFASNFLDTLKGLATNIFTIHQVPASWTQRFYRMNFKLEKAQFLAHRNLEWNSIPVKPSTELWTSKEWTDFVVVASGTEEFAVHKAILCPRSRFFKISCSPGFLEGTTGRVRLDEDNITVETLLMEIYSVENDTTGSVFTTFALKPEMRKECILLTLLKLFIASDKYDIPSIKNRAVKAIADRLPFVVAHLTIASLATSIFNECPENDLGLRDMIVDHIAARSNAMLEDDEAITELTQDTDIMKGMLRRVARLGTAVQDSPGETKEMLGMLTPPSTPDKRRSNRLTRGRGMPRNHH